MHCSAPTPDSCMTHTAHLGAVTEKQALPTPSPPHRRRRQIPGTLDTYFFGETDSSNMVDSSSPSSPNLSLLCFWRQNRHNKEHQQILAQDHRKELVRGHKQNTQGHCKFCVLESQWVKNKSMMPMKIKQKPVTWYINISSLVYHCLHRKKSGALKNTLSEYGCLDGLYWEALKTSDSLYTTMAHGVIMLGMNKNSGKLQWTLSVSTKSGKPKAF